MLSSRLRAAAVGLGVSLPHQPTGVASVAIPILSTWTLPTATTTATTPLFVSGVRASSSSSAVVGAGLIPVINKIQDVCSTINADIDLPQIVVMGGQSSGKSSVLESLVGRDFLPRGTGIVTRRPLILQLNRVEDVKEWGEFAHRKGEKFYDFREIRNEIVADTDRVTGKNKGISPEPIILKIYSPNVLPLTLVDTPGMTRVAVGDQPTDIEEQILRMVRSFVDKPSAIILAVHPANQDLATSDAIKLAREVDPGGHRTIGVVTKLDLMDAGTNALDLLMGRVYPLKLGFVGVVNRSQQDIRNNKSVGSAIEAERQFFLEHPVYKHIADHAGIAFLEEKCSKLLTAHIRRTIPDLKLQISYMLNEVVEELDSLGHSPSHTTEGQGWMLLQILNQVAKDFTSAVDGNTKTSLDMQELNGGARIRYVFSDIFGRKMDDMVVDLDMDDIRTAIKNTAGARPALFVPEPAFELLIKSQIERFREPCLQAAEVVYNELLRTVSLLDNNELDRFQVLREGVIDTTSSLLRKCLVPTRRMITNLIECELSYINTNHHNFVTGAELLQGNFISEHDTDRIASQYSSRPSRAERRQQQQQQQASGSSSGDSKSGLFGYLFGGSSGNNANANRPASAQPQPSYGSAGRQRNNNNNTGNKRGGSSAPSLEDPPHVLRVTHDMTEREITQVATIKKLLDSYFDIVRDNLKDMVAKSIMHFLVANAKDNIQRELVSALYKDSMYETLMSESPLVQSRRNELEQKRVILNKANEILQLAEVRDIPKAEAKQ